MAKGECNCGAVAFEVHDVLDAATFLGGVPVGHTLENRSESLTRCLVVDTRAPVDRITYPDHDRVCHSDRSLPDDVWTNNAGEPTTIPYALSHV